MSVTGRERVLEVNFRNLGDSDKQSCNEFLAKQNQPIEFEEDHATGSFVAHIKFVRSPTKGRKGSPTSTRLYSPEKNTGNEDRLKNRKNIPPRSSSKKKSNSPSRASKARDDHQEKTRSKSKKQSPVVIDKLMIVGTYQPSFPKQELSNSSFRPILIGKMFLVERIEAIYSHGTNRVFAGLNNPTCPAIVTDYLWDKYNKNQNQFHQGLINLLYSVGRLRENNVDVEFFSSFLLQEKDARYFYTFIILREIFQNITKIMLFEYGKLKTDPIRIVVSKEVTDEIVTIVLKENESGLKEAKSKVNNFYNGLENVDYYDVMIFLLNMMLSINNFDPTTAINYLFQYQSNPLENSEDYGYSYGRNSRSPSPFKKQTAEEIDRSGLYQQERYPPSTSQADQGLEMSPEIDRDRLKPTIGESTIQNKVQAFSPDGTTERLMNFSARDMNLEPEPKQWSPGEVDVIPKSSNRNTKYMDLNMFLRTRMTSLISKFIEAIIEDQRDKYSSNSSQGIKLKLHAIVNRKCQHLLTSLFSAEKIKFVQLLNIAVESDKDAIIIDSVFSQYENLQNEASNSLEERQINDFLKQILKIDHLANHISNLILYTTTPLEEIIRQR